MTTEKATRVKRRPGRPPKQRTQAPQKVSVHDEYYTDPSLNIIVRAKKAMKREGVSYAGKQFGWGDPKQDKDYYEDQGWQFVITKEANGQTKQWKHRGDPLMMRDAAIGKKEGDMVAQISREQFSSTMEGTNEAFEAEDREGVTHALSPN